MVLGPDLTTLPALRRTAKRFPPWGGRSHVVSHIRGMHY